MSIETNARRAKLADKSFREKVKRLIGRRSFCSLATVSPDGKPHVVAIGYKFINQHIYFNTLRSSKKARNIETNPNIAIQISVRKYPLGPPFSIQFAGQGCILSREDPEIVDLLKAGKLKGITTGVLKEPDLCFVKVKPASKIHTYGIGLSLLQLLRAPAHADRTVIFED